MTVLSDVLNSGGFDCEKGGFGKRDVGENGCFGLLILFVLFFLILLVNRLEWAFS